MSRVAQFDTGQSISIIGEYLRSWDRDRIPIVRTLSSTFERIIIFPEVTGFLGKLSTEKLLRSSPNIGTIHLLIRDKKGQSVEERVAALLTDSLYKLARKFGEVSRALRYFTTRTWDFENNRVQDLRKRLGYTDRQVFPFNMEDVDWDEHTVKMIRDIRKYIAYESEANLPQARLQNTCLSSNSAASIRTINSMGHQQNIVCLLHLDRPEKPWDVKSICKVIMNNQMGIVV